VSYDIIVLLTLLVFNNTPDWLAHCGCINHKVCKENSDSHASNHNHLKCFCKGKWCISQGDKEVFMQQCPQIYTVYF